MPLAAIAAAALKYAPEAVGLLTSVEGYRQSRKDPYKGMRNQFAANAQRLEAGLTGAVVRRMSGQLTPMERAEVQRAYESSRSDQDAIRSNLIRESTRRGVRGSAAYSALAEDTVAARERAGTAEVAGIEATGQARAMSFAQVLATENRRR